MSKEVLGIISTTYKDNLPLQTPFLRNSQKYEILLIPKALCFIHTKYMHSVFNYLSQKEYKQKPKWNIRTRMNANITSSFDVVRKHQPYTDHTDNL